MIPSSTPRETASEAAETAFPFVPRPIQLRRSQRKEARKTIAYFPKTPRKSKTQSPASQSSQSVWTMPTERIQITIAGATLHLKTREEKDNLSMEEVEFLNTFYRGGSAERYRQLEYILDPERAVNGFYDNQGHIPMIPEEKDCRKRVDGDIVYSDMFRTTDED